MPQMLETLKDLLQRLSAKQKIQIAVALAGTVLLIWGLSLYTTRARYALLFKVSDPAEAADVIAELQDLAVPYRVGRGGRTIEVPASRVDELRMTLAGEGLPRGGGVGFEIFDRPSFGVSDFVQNVNYRRALERELARSVQSLDAVETARVHLALPQESVFADEERQASASVVVDLGGGLTLTRDQVRAISHLVASGVEKLDVARVSVVDAQGRMLTEPDQNADGLALSSAQHEARLGLERQIESTLIAILEPIVGSGRVRARATVELETSSVERVEERYDPAGAVVRSEQRNKTKTQGSGPGGAPGTASNLPGGTAAGAGAGARQESQASTTNFEINRTVSTIAEPRGTLVRKSVAVVVDNAPAEDAGETEEPPASVPRTPDEMKKITALVRAAVGIDELRGDVLIVENVPFDDDGSTSETGGVDWLHLTTTVLRYLAPVLAALLVILLVIRPGLKVVRELPAAVKNDPKALPTVAEVQASLGDTGGSLPGSSLRQKLIEAATENPEAAALVVRGWVSESREETV